MFFIHFKQTVKFGQLKNCYFIIFNYFKNELLAKDFKNGMVLEDISALIDTNNDIF